MNKQIYTVCVRFDDGDVVVFSNVSDFQIEEGTKDKGGRLSITFNVKQFTGHYSTNLNLVRAVELSLV